MIIYMSMIKSDKMRKIIRLFVEDASFDTLGMGMGRGVRLVGMKQLIFRGI